MIALRFRFASGRYHATAWGSHVNEGAPDWPPAPWRICRALIATWFHKHRALVEESNVRNLVEALASAAPFYALPVATSAHTRHYMPINKINEEAGVEIFDTFVQIDPKESIDALWPVELDPGQRELLATLLGSLNYLGRAESLVEAVLLPFAAKLPESNARPITEEAPLRDSEEEPIRLLAPMTTLEYAAWLAERAEPAQKEKVGKKAKQSDLGFGGEIEENAIKSKATKKTKQSALPANLFDALLAETGDLKAAGWSQPPGSRWIDYARPAESFRIAPQRQPRPDLLAKPTVARYAIVSDVPPGITQALSLGERFHRALVSRCAAPVFTGCQPLSEPSIERPEAERRPIRPLTGDRPVRDPLTGHEHAYYLSEADPKRGTVKFLTLFARMGFGKDERQALEQLRQTWGYDGHKLQLVLLGMGKPKDFAEADAPQGQSLSLSSAKVWTSHTPFVPTRHLKTRKNGEPKLDESGLAIGSPEHELRRLLREGGFPEPLSIEHVSALLIGERRIHWLEFQRNRKNGDGRHVAGNSGYGFRIAFSNAVNGPIALGYGAHFGLGLFVPEEKHSSSPLA